MRNKDKNISEMSENTSIFITLCVVACVLALVGVKIVLTTM